MPSAISSSMATNPAAVPGTLIITFGRPAFANSASPAATVPVASWASAGETSTDT